MTRKVGPRPRHRGGDRSASATVTASGFWTRDVLARPERGHDLVGVHPGGRQQLDRVDRGIVQHLREVGVEPGRDAPLAGPALGPLGIVSQSATTSQRGCCR